MARTRWPSIREPRPLAQARQIRSAPPVGAGSGTRPTGRWKDSLSGVGRIAGQAGSQDPTLRPCHHKTTEARHASELLWSSLPIWAGWRSAKA